MKTELLINRLKDLRDNGECVSETAVLEQAIKSIEALEKIRVEIGQKAKPNEIGGRGNGKSIKYGLCMALEIIDKHLAEAET
mgnify:CR=1 FL=1